MIPLTVAIGLLTLVVLSNDSDEKYAKLTVLGLLITLLLVAASIVMELVVGITHSTTLSDVLWLKLNWLWE